MMDHFNYRQPPLFFFLALLFAGLLLVQPGRWNATPALAQTALGATQDTFVDPNNATTNYDGKRLELAYSNFPTLVGTRRVLLQFDLRNVAASLSAAPVVLSAVENNFPAGATLTLGLYELTDTWTEAAVTESTRPLAGAKLQTVTVAAGTTGAVRFEAAAVGAYLEAERTGDGVASLLLQLEAGSGTLGFGGNLFFEDSEGSSNGVNGDEPAIDAPTAPTATPTNTTAAPTATNTPVTPTPTNTTAAPTATPTNTTAAPTATPTNTTEAPTATPTNTTAAPTPTPTNTTEAPTATPTNTTEAPTATPTNTATNTTEAPTATSTATATATNTTAAPTATATNTTEAPTATATPTTTTEAPTVTATSTTEAPTATATNTTEVPTATATPTNTTEAPTATPTNTTEAPTATPTNTTEAPTATATPTNTTEAPTATPTNTTEAPTATATSTLEAPTATPTVTPTSAVTPAGQTVYYLSSNANGQVGGIEYRDEDILRYRQTDGWQLVFNGSDVGLKKNALDDFAFLPDGSLLMSFAKPMKLPGLGLENDRLDDADIVRFVPTSLGVNTSGTFSLYFDGSDVGLTTGNEDIDALSLDGQGNLILSTVGSFKVEGVTGRDEDLLKFIPTSLGANTAGRWELFFDSSTVDLTASSEDLNALWLDPSQGTLYLSTKGDFQASGSQNSIAGDRNDLFGCTRVAESCFFFAVLDGDTVNFKPRISGVSLDLTGNSVPWPNAVGAGGELPDPVTQFEVLPEAPLEADDEYDAFDLPLDDDTNEALLNHLFLPLIKR